jgi:hypothetical protein
MTDHPIPTRSRSAAEREAPIQVSIPVELTAAMVIRAGVIKDEARARDLAVELHDVVAKCVELYWAQRAPNALEIADFTLAVWQWALVSNSSPSDGSQAGWISETLAALTLNVDDDDLYLRWLMIGDVVTGSDSDLPANAREALMQAINATRQ